MRLPPHSLLKSPLRLRNFEQFGMACGQKFDSHRTRTALRLIPARRFPDAQFAIQQDMLILPRYSFAGHPGQQ
jgi:hypothetical protein